MDGQLKLPQSYAGQVQAAKRPAPNPAIEQQISDIYAKQTEQRAMRAAAQFAALEEEKAQRLAAFDEDIATNLDPALGNYPQVQHEIRRERALIEVDALRKAELLRASGMQSGVGERQMHALEKNIENQYGSILKPWEETEGYKEASKNWQYLRGKKDILTNLNSLLGKAQDIYQQSVTAEREGNAELAGSLRKQVTDFSSQSIAKALNSAITSSDAISVGELLTKFPQLVTAGQQSQLQKVSPFSPKMLIARWLDMDKKEKTDLADQFVQVFESDPEGFLKNAIEASNIFSNTFNSSLKDQVINITSPGGAKRMGAVPIQEIVNLISPSEQQKPNPLHTQYPFGTTISTGAGTMTPSAPQMLGQAPMQAPVKQPEQSPLNQRVGGPTLFRIEPRR